MEKQHINISLLNNKKDLVNSVCSIRFSFCLLKRRVFVLNVNKLQSVNSYSFPIWNKETYRQ